MKTPNHIKHVAEYLSNERKEEEIGRKEIVQKRFEQVERLYPGKFELLKLTSNGNEVRCKHCNQLISLAPERGSFTHNIEEHRKSCKKIRKRQVSLENFVIATKRPKSSLRLEEKKIVKTNYFGYFYDKIKVSDNEYSMKPLKEVYNEGYSRGVVCWYSIPRYTVNLNGRAINGTIRSSKCKLVTDDTNENICSSCRDLVREQSFIKRIQRSNNKDVSCHKKKTQDSTKLTTGKNNRLLNSTQKAAKLKYYRKLCSLQNIKILKLSQKYARLRASKQKLSDKLARNTRRGDVLAIVHNLNIAYEKGLLQGKT